MFLDLDANWTPPEPWTPPPHRAPRLTKRKEGLVMGLVGFNVLMLLLAPIAGVTFFDILVAALR